MWESVSLERWSSLTGSCSGLSSGPTWARGLVSGEWKAPSESVPVVLSSSVSGSLSECDARVMLLPEETSFSSGSVCAKSGTIVPCSVSSSGRYVVMNMKPCCAGAE